MQAAQNIAVLNGYEVKRIVTGCPHCFNVLKNEYPELGGNYEVMHHTQFIRDLIDQGRLKVADGNPFKGRRITFHDPCYLGRGNGEYAAPREVLSTLDAELVEMRRCKQNGLCCGAGGARMWMEEDIGDKVNDVRAKELVETGADRVAVACPFCYVMMDDGVKAAGKEEDEVRVADIAITVLEAIETGEAKSQAASLASQTELASLSLQRPSDDGGVTTQD